MSRDLTLQLIALKLIQRFSEFAISTVPTNGEHPHTDYFAPSTAKPNERRQKSISKFPAQLNSAPY
jgi:hypothetical protein